MKHATYSNSTFNPVCVCVGGGGESMEKTVVMIQLIMGKIKKASAKSIFHGVEDGIKLMLHLFTAGEVLQPGVSLEPRCWSTWTAQESSSKRQRRGARRYLWLGVWVEKWRGEISSCVFRYTEKYINHQKFCSLKCVF